MSTTLYILFNPRTHQNILKNAPKYTTRYKKKQNNKKKELFMVGLEPLTSRSGVKSYTIYTKMPTLRLDFTVLIYTIPIFEPNLFKLALPLKTYPILLPLKSHILLESINHPCKRHSSTVKLVYRVN